CERTGVALNDDSFEMGLVERETRAATQIVLPSLLRASSIYANVRRAYTKLADIVGEPPFELALGKKARRAETFDALRFDALELAKEGIQVSRFKGLGEMNPDELRETTMDPARRMLVRVEVEDAAAADLVFSMLMGDQVE